MTTSALTTAAERDAFLKTTLLWLETHLDTAPREQLDAVHAALHRWRPTPSNAPTLYGDNGSGRLWRGER